MSSVLMFKCDRCGTLAQAIPTDALSTSPPPGWRAAAAKNIHYCSKCMEPVNVRDADNQKWLDEYFSPQSIVTKKESK